MQMESFNKLLLDLYRGADVLPLTEFRHFALKRVQEQLPFDAAIWSATTLTQGRPHVYAWLQSGITEESIDLINRNSEQDVIGQRTAEQLGRTLYFEVSSMEPSPLIKVLIEHNHVRHMLATAVRDERLHTTTILLLARRGDAPFTEAERLMKEMLMPHLELMAVRNFQAQVIQARAAKTAGMLGIALLDITGCVLIADAEFPRLVNEQWPAWTGHTLPDDIRCAQQRGETTMVCERVTVHLMQRETHTLLLVARRTAVDSLTPKERLIAAEFANGKSHKEVANMFKLSPQTVRSRLQVVYAKLGINDKSELAPHFDVAHQVAAILRTY